MRSESLCTPRPRGVRDSEVSCCYLTASAHLEQGIAKPIVVIVRDRGAHCARNHLIFPQGLPNMVADAHTLTKVLQPTVVVVRGRGLPLASRCASDVLPLPEQQTTCWAQQTPLIE